MLIYFLERHRVLPEEGQTEGDAENEENWGQDALQVYIATPPTRVSVLVHLNDLQRQKHPTLLRPFVILHNCGRLVLAPVLLGDGGGGTSERVYLKE